jgi:hypothetical protein
MLGKDRDIRVVCDASVVTESSDWWVAMGDSWDILLSSAVARGKLNDTAERLVPESGGVGGPRGVVNGVRVADARGLKSDESAARRAGWRGVRGAAVCIGRRGATVDGAGWRLAVCLRGR